SVVTLAPGAVGPSTLVHGRAMLAPRGDRSLRPRPRSDHRIRPHSVVLHHADLLRRVGGIPRAPVQSDPGAGPSLSSGLPRKSRTILASSSAPVDRLRRSSGLRIRL